MTFSERAVEAAARAICCKAHKLGCAAIHDGSPFSACQAHTYRDDARNALTAALAVDGMALQGWRTIDSAPQDGTAIWLLIDGKPYLGFGEQADPPLQKEQWIACASFRRKVDRPAYRTATAPDEIYSCLGYDQYPTHWQPLPAPPLTAASDGEVG